VNILDFHELLIYSLKCNEVKVQGNNTEIYSWTNETQKKHWKFMAPLSFKIFHISV